MSPADSFCGVRILVTGGAGMLGGHLVERLAGHHEVIALDLVGTRSAGATTIIGDVRDEALLSKLTAGTDAVVHCAAALPSHPRGEIWSVDVDGTACVLRQAARHRVARVIHVSSTAVYGLPDVVPTPEEHPFSPVDAYSAAKGAAEQLCERYRAEGRCVTVLRPKTFLGPQRLGLFAMLFEWASEGRGFPMLGGGRIRSQLLDVQDLCDVIIACLHRPAEQVNDAFNVGAAEFGLLRDEFQAVLDEAGHDKRVVSIPARPAIAALRLLEMTRLSPVYRRLIYKLNHDSYVSIAKAQACLGFSPRYSNTATLLRTYRWYRETPQAARRRPGRSHRDPWRQGALAVAKSLF